MTAETVAKLVNGAKRYAPETEPDDRSRLDSYWAADLPDEPESEEQLVEGVIGRIAMSVLFGEPNSGKTYLILDLGIALARKVTWMGRHTFGGLVLYLATESERSIRTRLQAYQRHHGLKVPNFAVVRNPINLFDGTADAMAVVAKVQEIEAETGLKCELVICDTLARMSAGANENSGEDMGTVIAHAELIMLQARVHVMLIHHSGKDAAKGARGWSGLRGAVDTEIEVSEDQATGLRVAEITKQRDIPGKGDRIGFRLQTVEMGIGQWGKLRTSCVVVPADAPAKASKGKRLSEVAGAVVETLHAHGAGMKKAEIAKHLADRYQRTSVYREIGKLLESRRLIETAGIVALNKADTANWIAS